MDAIALPKNLFDRAMKAGVTTIRLEFSGGNDEGYLDVVVEGGDNLMGKKNDPKLDEDIQEWADDAYGYSGAGDGSAYGDTVIYDLVKMKVTTQEWMMQRKESPEEEGDLEVGSDDEGSCCRECGNPMMVGDDGVSHHLSDDGWVDHDLDADHVAIAEVE